MESRLQNLLDRDAIHDVLVCYATSLDDRDWDRLAGCFTDDAIADYGAGIFEGPEAIVGLCRQMLEPLELSQHLLGSFEITVTGETATRVKAIKEEGLDLSRKSRSKVGGALQIYYDDLIATVVEGIGDALSRTDRMPKLDKPLWKTTKRN